MLESIHLDSQVQTGYIRKWWVVESQPPCEQTGPSRCAQAPGDQM